MKLPSLLCLLAFAPLVVHAQSNAEMKEEAASILDKSDTAMNKAYQQLLSILNDEGKKRLRETQRAWLAYRDAQAGFDSHHMAGGTGEGLERLGSLNMLTEERTKRLQEDYKRFKELQ
ncbi:DUF1311 domain-containing protein [Luteolibacter sp. SL250]|uniref:lysozyme inhibitor LprI family protein n=1 Tax=Luteolibacter sp. SL250 TaxID=2995170 RepID=UPI00226F8EE1|nr:lysozyme inhibitor LprI family protein [Luteolibacter sp. SL250]WAC20720.1 DUF1311 domain-containing protein [Luteolibacter sp. SL250]